MKTSMKSKLVVVLVLYSALCIAIVVYVGKNLLANRYHIELADAAVREVITAAEVRTLVNRQLKEILDGFLADEDDDEQEEFDDFHQEIMAAMLDWRDLSIQSYQLGVVSEHIDISYIDDIRGQYHVCLEQIKTAFDMIEDGNSDTARVYLKETIEPFVDEMLLERIDNAVTDELREAPEAYRQVLLDMGSVPWVSKKGGNHIQQALQGLQDFEAADTVRTCIVRQMREVMAYLLTTETKDLAQYEALGFKAKDTFRRWHESTRLSCLQGVEGEEADEDQLKSIEKAYDKVTHLMDECLRLHGVGDEEEIFDTLEDEVEPLVDTLLIPTLNAAVRDEVEEVKAAHQALHRTLTRAGVTGLVVATVVLSSMLLVVVRVVMGVMKSIRQLKDAAQTVGQGDLNYRMELPRQSEFSRVAEAFNQMTANLSAAQEALAESEERSRSVLQTAPDLILTVDRNGTILFSNRSWNGITPLELQEKRLYDVLPEDTHHILRAVIEQTFLAGTMDAFELEIKDEITSSRSWLASRIGPLRQDREVVAATIITTDITNRKRAEAENELLERELRQAQKMEAIGTLAGGIAHDFNNILGSMLGFTDLVKEELPAESLEYRNLEKVVAAGLRAKALIRQILTFSRKDELKMELLSITEIVEEVVPLIRSSLPATIELQTTIEDTDRRIFGDPTQIHQVLLNLSNNANEAMDADTGVLAINLSTCDFDCPTSVGDQILPAGAYLKLVVKDNGAGIDEATLQRIFEPFFTTRDVDQGTGLGLATVHGIIQNHGGGVAVESRVGIGTAFTIYLPSVNEAEVQTQEKESAIVGGQNECILLVDDEEDLLEATHQMLEHMNYRVVSCLGSLDAVSVFEENPQQFDLVISDYAMPSMSGKELIQKLKVIRPDLPVILCTGYCDGMDECTAASMGIWEIIRKPVIRKELDDCIHRVLKKSGVLCNRNE